MKEQVQEKINGNILRLGPQTKLMIFQVVNLSKDTKKDIGLQDITLMIIQILLRHNLSQQDLRILLIQPT